MKRRGPQTIVILVAVAAAGVFAIGFLHSGPKPYSGPKACRLLVEADIAISQKWAATTLRQAPLEVSENLSFNEASPVRSAPNRTTRAKVKVGTTCIYRFGEVKESPYPDSLDSLRMTVNSMRFVSPEWAYSLMPTVAVAQDGTASQRATPTIPEAALAGLGEPHIGQHVDGRDGTSMCIIVQQLGDYLLQTSEYGKLADCTDTIRLSRVARTRLMLATAPPTSGPR